MSCPRCGALFLVKARQGEEAYCRICGWHDFGPIPDEIKARIERWRPRVDHNPGGQYRGRELF